MAALVMRSINGTSSQLLKEYSILGGKVHRLYFLSRWGGTFTLTSLNGIMALSVDFFKGCNTGCAGTLGDLGESVKTKKEN